MILGILSVIFLNDYRESDNQAIPSSVSLSTLFLSYIVVYLNIFMIILMPLCMLIVLKPLKYLNIQKTTL